MIPQCCNALRLIITTPFKINGLIELNWCTIKLINYLDSGVGDLAYLARAMRLPLEVVEGIVESPRGDCRREIDERIAHVKPGPTQAHKLTSFYLVSQRINERAVR